MDSLETKIDTLTEQTRQLIWTHRVNDAIRLLESNRELVERSPRLQYDYGSCMLQIDNFLAMNNTAERLIREHPETWHGYDLKGLWLRHEKRFAESVDYLINAARKNSDSPLGKILSLKMLASSFTLIGKHKESIDAFREMYLFAQKFPWILEEHPQLNNGYLDDQDLLMMGRNYLHLRHFPHVIATMKLMLSKPLESPEMEIEIRRSLAVSYQETGKEQEALEQYRLLSAKEPDNIEFKRNIASCLTHLKMYDDAIRITKEILEKNPRYGYAWGTLHGALMEKGKQSNSKETLEEALIAIDKALELMPESATYKSQKAVTYLHMGRYDEADRILDGLSRENPNSASFLHGITLKYFLQGRIYESALAALDSLGASDIYEGNYRMLLQNFHRSIMSLPKPEEAAADLMKMYRKNKRDPRIGVFLTTLLDYMHNDELAEQISQEVVDGIIKDPSLRSSLFPLDFSSKNPVKLAFINILSPNLYIVKTTDSTRDEQSEQRRLENEYRVTTSLRKISDKLPVMLTCRNGFLFEKRIRAENLDSYDFFSEKQGETEDEVRKSLETIIPIQIFGADQLQSDGVTVEKFDYITSMRKRLVERLGNTPQALEFHRQYQNFLNRRLATIYNQEFFQGLQQGDPNYGNTLVGGYWVDMENVRRGSVVVDAAHLLSIPTRHGIDIESVFGEYSENYIQAKRHSGTAVPSGIDKNMRSLFDISMLHSNISLIGPMLAKGNDELAKQHFRQAAEALRQYGERDLFELLRAAIITRPNPSQSLAGRT